MIHKVSNSISESTNSKLKIIYFDIQSGAQINIFRNWNWNGKANIFYTNITFWKLNSWNGNTVLEFLIFKDLSHFWCQLQLEVIQLHFELITPKTFYTASIVIYQHIFFDIHRTMQRHYSLCRCCRVVVYHSYIVRSCGFTVLRCAELWCIHVMLCRAVVYNCCTECGLFLLCCTGLWYVTVTLFRIYHCYIVQTCDLVSRCI